MAFISVSRTLKTLTTRTLSTIPLPLLTSRHVSSSSSASSDLDPPPPPPIEPPTDHAEDSESPPPTASRRSRFVSDAPDPPHEVICRMMSNRKWTTRLENSIRYLVPDFDRDLVTKVLRGSAKPGHALQFFRFVERSGLFAHDESTHLEILSILTRASMLNHARCILLGKMPRKRPPVERTDRMFALLIDGYGRAGISQEAVKLFDKMGELGIDRTTASYDAFFKAILRSGRTAMAKRYFNRMVKDDGVAATAHTYNTLIWGFCLSKEMTTANRFFEEMRQRGIVPDVVTYNTLINGFGRVGKMEEAERLFGEMVGLNLNPDVVSYTVMIKGYVLAGRVDDALRWFNEMGEKGVSPSEKTYSVLLSGLCENGGAEVGKLLEEMKEKGLKPVDLSVLSRLVSRQCELGDLGAAVRAVELMGAFDVRPSASDYGALIEGFIKGGSFDRAAELLDEMLENGTLSSSDSEMGSSAYVPLIEHLCNNGQTKKAEIFFRQLMKRGVDDPTAFNHLIRGHAKEGSPESMVELLTIMGRRGVATEADVHASIVESYLKKGESADAKTALEGMVEAGHSVSPALYRVVLHALFEEGRVQSASRVMKVMVEKGVQDNMDLVASVLEALFMRGHVGEALGRIDLLMRNGCVPEYDELLKKLCEKDQLVTAARLVEFVLEKKCEMGSGTCDNVLVGLMSAGKTLDAYSLACNVKKNGRVVEEGVYRDLIKSLNEEGNTKQADTLTRMVFKGEVPSEEGYAKQADILSRMDLGGETEPARKRRKNVAVNVV
ncbi:Pentatricopeptide repeat-containing protein [Acorus gramineus]|uniref:Pentatricopeptide repeat-containing protein n=1 Tax=Acorus gramineus TaxID=55184 RepID=A0AAV9AQU4_ACOGR|nr:Pentatricopeptide repeat-containing protein [Acorus gramineus]